VRRANYPWHADDVTLNCTASDGGSGLANAADSSFTLTASAESANANTPTVVTAPALSLSRGTVIEDLLAKEPTKKCNTTSNQQP
jgi:hypothetical protein